MRASGSSRIARASIAARGAAAHARPARVGTALPRRIAPPSRASNGMAGTRPRSHTAQAGAANGAFMLDSLRFALDLAQRGEVDAVCFAPLNKAALRAGGMRRRTSCAGSPKCSTIDGAVRRIQRARRICGRRASPRTFRCKDVAGLLSAEGVAEAIGMLHDALRRAGNAAPRIGVCGLNPHNGDNGSYRPRGDRHHRAGRRARRADAAIAPTARIRPIRSSSRAQERRLRRHRHDVPRPGPDRDEADGLRARRHGAGRPAGCRSRRRRTAPPTTSPGATSPTRRR